MRILLADDETDAVHPIFRTLIKAGFQVDFVHDGLELLKLWETLRHPLVISDINMPGKDGVDACAEIRQREPATKIILMSGSPESLERARLNNFKLRLSKPFDQETILSYIRQALGH